MIPNNNFSVLPWYTSIEQQNARKWWVYRRTYPLFTPAGFLPPFQLMREKESTKQYAPGTQMTPNASYPGRELKEQNGMVYLEQTEATAEVQRFDVEGLSDVYFVQIPRGTAINIIFATKNDVVITADGYEKEDSQFTGGMAVPDGTKWVYIQQFWETLPSYFGQVDEAIVTLITTPVTGFQIYTKDGTSVGEYPQICNRIQIKTIGDYDYLVYPSNFPFAPSFENGQYYARIIAGTKMWFSEIFTVVNDIQPYLKIEWWDLEDFRMDAGAIVYKNPAFRNVLYLDATIAKPEYPFEEEGETRDGYFFPVKMISEKRYRFKFLASEYLLDVMRFIRMADFAQITANGQTYSLDTFLITPEWESEGDVASVEAQFDTATVAKKIGTGYIKAQRGDFNDDFNNDFNN